MDFSTGTRERRHSAVAMSFPGVSERKIDRIRDSHLHIAGQRRLIAVGMPPLEHMWFEILPSFLTICGCMAAPHVIAPILNYIVVGHYYRRELTTTRQRRDYLRDARLTGSPYVVAGLESLADEQEAEDKDADSKLYLTDPVRANIKVLPCEEDTAHTSPENRTRVTNSAENNHQPTLSEREVRRGGGCTDRPKMEGETEIGVYGPNFQVPKASGIAFSSFQAEICAMELLNHLWTLSLSVAIKEPHRSGFKWWEVPPKRNIGTVEDGKGGVTRARALLPRSLVLLKAETFWKWPMQSSAGFTPRPTRPGPGAANL
ncbi:hypothetical protein NQ317_001027 [Molorchus minor]|uniref:Uncharacterized protein n=1 Tax=Molorchus minor TaxID=1323400 RepID=A0ABQ9J777_9CUCU|nr:hypothetical protein NQ317_001027 [Molorchus minor]